MINCFWNQNAKKMTSLLAFGIIASMHSVLPMGIPVSFAENGVDKKFRLVRETMNNAQLGPFIQSFRACTEKERWWITKELRQTWDSQIAIFKDPHSSKDSGGKMSKSDFLDQSLAMALADAYALQSVEKYREIQLFGVYWKYRTLFEAGMVHHAVMGLEELVLIQPDEKTIGVQFAALDCLNHIQTEYPALARNQKIFDQLPVFLNYIASSPQRNLAKRVVIQATEQWYNTRLSEEAEETERMAILKRLADDPARFNFYAGMEDLLKFDYHSSAYKFEQFFKFAKTDPELERYKDEAHLLAARSYYGIEEFEKAHDHFQKVDKSSNDMVRVLAEMSWVLLMLGKLDKTIGTSITLQGGGFHNTFVPEASIAMAMAFNELCQYPAALRGIRYFHRKFRPAYDWLNKWVQRDEVAKKAEESNRKIAGKKIESKFKTPLYNKLLTFIETGQTDLPPQIVSEWVRNRVFLANQDEINLLLDEKSATRNLSSSYRITLNRLTQEIKKLYQSTRERRKEVAGGKMSSELENDLLQLKDWLGRRKRLKRVVRELNRYIRIYKNIEAPRHASLLKGIEFALMRDNYRMVKKLRSMAESAYLLKIEIYQGASQDIVWQNAHPEYQKFIDKTNQERERKLAAQTWNWGSMEVGEDGKAEVWEDELGSLKASLFDNCSNQNKYLNIQINSQ